jgi:hypothetical protein
LGFGVSSKSQLPNPKPEEAPMAADYIQIQIDRRARQDAWERAEKEKERLRLDLVDQIHRTQDGLEHLDRETDKEMRTMIRRRYPRWWKRRQAMKDPFVRQLLIRLREEVKTSLKRELETKLACLEEVRSSRAI